MDDISGCPWTPGTGWHLGAHQLVGSCDYLWICECPWTPDTCWILGIHQLLHAHPLWMPMDSWVPVGCWPSISSWVPMDFGCPQVCECLLAPGCPSAPLCLWIHGCPESLLDPGHPSAPGYPGSPRWLLGAHGPPGQLLSNHQLLSIRHLWGAL